METLPSSGLLSVRELRINRVKNNRIDRVLVDGVSFDVIVGETIGFVGESGSGKSLTAKALVDLLPDSLRASGSICFDGRELLADDHERHSSIRGRDISLLMQDPFTMLNPAMRAGAHISETIRTYRGRGAPRGEAMKAEVARRLAEVGIDDPAVADRYPFELSGGMSQRVALAASLAGDPRLLIADEPTTALDATTQKEILELLLKIQKSRQMSLILITHDLRLSFAVCERIFVMYAGSIVESSPASELLKTQTHPYSRDLVRSVPSSSHYQPTLLDIPGAVPATSDVVDRCAYAPRCEFAAPSCVTAKPALTPVLPGRLSACARFADVRVDLMRLPIDVPTDAPRIESEARAPLLTVNDLKKTYGKGSAQHAALKDASFSLGHGESLGIVGESGSGKTTIAKILLGLEDPTSGSIRLGDSDLSDYSGLSKPDLQAARRAIQCVFQDPYSSLNPLHSIGFALSEALKRRGVPKSDVRAETYDLLERVGLPASVAGRKPSALSGGQRQRVAIARSLAIQPRLLICDEPVAALDVSVQAQILRLLRSIHDEGSVSLLFITHDLAVVRQVTDRVIVLCKGEIVEQGQTDHVLDAPQHDYTRRLVESMP